MHKICCLFSLVRLLFQWKICSGRAPRCNTWWQNLWRLESENHRTVACLCRCNASRCLIWHSANTRLLGFVTFYGPSAPVLPIVLEFSIFGMKLDSLSQFVCGSLLENSKLFSSPWCIVFFFLMIKAEDMMQLGRTATRFSPGPLNVMLFFDYYWHVA